MCWTFKPLILKLKGKKCVQWTLSHQRRIVIYYISLSLAILSEVSSKIRFLFTVIDRNPRINQ